MPFGILDDKLMKPKCKCKNLAKNTIEYNENVIETNC
jgi:hypothetical protein